MSVTFHSSNHFEKQRKLSTKARSKFDAQSYKQQLLDAHTSYMIQLQRYLHYRQEKRRLEHERIQKENLRFSQKLINARSSVSRVEHQVFYQKHCQLRRHLQQFPTKLKKSGPLLIELNPKPNARLNVVQSERKFSTSLTNKTRIQKQTVR